MRGGFEFPPMAEGSKGSEAARAPGPFPCAIVGWAVLPLPAGCTCVGCQPILEQVPTPLGGGGLLPEHVQGRFPG